jgi:hypothetical protein
MAIRRKQPGSGPKRTARCAGCGAVEFRETQISLSMEHPGLIKHIVRKGPICQACAERIWSWICENFALGETLHFEHDPETGETTRIFPQPKSS